jgi:hypothetical protein
MNKIFQKLFGETANGIANIVDRFVESWVDLLQIVLITVIGAYFGSRGLEKYSKK